MAFLKHKAFWISVAHVAIIAAGTAGSVMTGTPFPLMASSAVNAMLGSPLHAVQESRKG